jgi:hypothetical protein
LLVRNENVYSTCHVYKYFIGAERKIITQLMMLEKKDKSSNSFTTSIAVEVIRVTKFNLM